MHCASEKRKKETGWEEGGITGKIIAVGSENFDELIRENG